MKGGRGMNGVFSKFFKKRNAAVRGNSKTLHQDREILLAIAHQYFMSLPHSYFLPGGNKNG